MRRIELLGPSGVGKTTLFKRISKTPEASRPYSTLGEAYKHAALQRRIPVSKLQLWFFQKLIQTGLFRNREHGLGKTVLKGLKNEEKLLAFDSYDVFYPSYHILLECYKNESHPFVVYKRISVYTKKIDEYLTLQNSLSNDNCVLFDEGVLHKHPGITEYGINNFSPEELRKDPAFNPAGIISCEQDAGVIFEQAIKRKKQGTYTFTQGGMSRNELRNHVEANVNHHKRKIDLFKNINTPVLHINPREKPALNIQKINRFIESMGR